MKKYPIVFATDNNYVLPMCVAIQSLKNSNGDLDLDIYIFTKNSQTITEENKNIINLLKSDKCNITIFPVEEMMNKEKYEHLYGTWKFPVEAFYRVFIPTLLPQYEKVLYLDCDVLVLGSIVELFNIKFGKNCLLGVKEKYMSYMGFYGSLKMVNTGVLLFNNPKWLKEDLLNKCIKFVLKERNLVYIDQATINALPEIKIKKIPLRFNFLDTYRTKTYQISSKEIRTPPIILHCMYKPWIRRSVWDALIWWDTVGLLPSKIKTKIEEKYLPNIEEGEIDYTWYKRSIGNIFQKLIVRIAGIFWNLKNNTFRKRYSYRNVLKAWKNNDKNDV